MSSAPTCLRCGGATQYEGRVSLPAQIIYRCADCGNYLWVPQRMNAGAPPAEPPRLQQQPPAQQPQVQQAQQTQSIEPRTPPQPEE